MLLRASAPLRLCVKILLPLFALASTHAADWPQFRGPTGLGYVTDQNLPLHWNAKSNVNIAWKAALPKSDNAYSSPVVSGDRVFVTSAVNNPVEHHVLCFARADGSNVFVVVGQNGLSASKDGGHAFALAAPLPPGFTINRTGANHGWDAKADIFYASTMTKPTFKSQR